MQEISFNKNDIIERVYFITKLVQNQKGTTMQGALTSKSDSMGGIFDRFINTISDSLVFEKIILPQLETKKDVHIVNDYYFYNPTEKVSGIAPDIFGIRIDKKTIPFTYFNNKWVPVENMPQIEIKTYKAKDQMITLRDQKYKGYLVFTDLDLRIDYLVPFLDSRILNKQVIQNMKMDNSAFGIDDKNEKVNEITEIDYSSDKIGTLKVLAITNVEEFKKYATLCKANVSVMRIKSITKRMGKVKKDLLHENFNKYVNENKDIKGLYDFNKTWKKIKKIKDNTETLKFSADNIENIEICKHNKNGIVVTALKEGCYLNGIQLEENQQYTVNFETLIRDGNNGEEYFMQKQCAEIIIGKEKELINELKKIIEEN